MNQELPIYRRTLVYYAVTICMLTLSFASSCIVTNYLGLMWALFGIKWATTFWLL